MKKILGALFLLFFNFSLYSDCFATKIIANVGGKVITDYDVDQRSKIIVFLRDLDSTDQQLMAYVRSEVVKFLIDEELKKEYINQIKVELPEGTLDIVLAEYVSKSKYSSVQDLKKALVKRDIDFDSFLESLKDEVAWSIVIRNVLIPSIKIADGEIEARASARGLDINKKEHVEGIKNEIMEEKIVSSVSKLMSQMKRLKHIEQLEDMDF